MGLSLGDLSAGREIIHDVEIASLGDTVKIRELSSKLMGELMEKHKNDDNTGITGDGVKVLLKSTLTDDDNATPTDEQIEMFLEQNQNSVINEITRAIIKVHSGSEPGES